MGHRGLLAVAALTVAGALSAYAAPASATNYVFTVDEPLTGGGNSKFASYSGAFTIPAVYLTLGDTLTVTDDFGETVVVPVGQGVFTLDTPSDVSQNSVYDLYMPDDAGPGKSYLFYDGGDSITFTVGVSVLRPPPTGVDAALEKIGPITGGSFFFSTAPEPAAWGLMLVGLGTLGGLLRARRSKLLRQAPVH